MQQTSRRKRAEQEQAQDTLWGMNAIDKAGRILFNTFLGKWEEIGALLRVLVLNEGAMQR